MFGEKNHKQAKSVDPAYSARTAGNLRTCSLATDPSTRAATTSLVSRLTHPTLRFDVT
jgi:hypothetical protein